MTTRNRLTAVERRVIEAMVAVINSVKDSIPFEEVHRGLPFQTRVAAGSNLNHIVVDSILPIEIDRVEGDTLCGRLRGGLREFTYGGTERNCPGCLAIAQGLVAKEQNREAIELLENFS